MSFDGIFDDIFSSKKKPDPKPEGRNYKDETIQKQSEEIQRLRRENDRLREVVESIPGRIREAEERVLSERSS